MNAKQLTKIEKINVKNYLQSLYDQREQAQREENMSLEIDTTNMIVGAKNILRLLSIEDLIE